MLNNPENANFPPASQPNITKEVEETTTAACNNEANNKTNEDPSHKYWNGNLPSPTGIITKEFANVPVATQLKQANIMAKFIMTNYTDDFPPSPQRH